MLKLSKLRHALELKVLRSVYYVILESHLCNAALTWAQNRNSLKIFIYYRKNKIMFFASRNSDTCPLFKVSKIFNSFDKTALNKCVFMSKFWNSFCLLPSVTSSNFLLSHTLMILDREILVILKYSLTILNPMVDIQCL